MLSGNLQPLATPWLSWRQGLCDIIGSRAGSSQLWGSASSSRSKAAIRWVPRPAAHHLSVVSYIQCCLLLSSHHSRPHQSTTSSTTRTCILSIAYRFHDNISSIQFWTPSQRRRQPNKSEQDGLLVDASNSVALVRPPPTPPPISTDPHPSQFLHRPPVHDSERMHHLGLFADLVPRLPHPPQDRPQHPAKAHLHARHAPHPLHLRSPL